MIDTSTPPDWDKLRDIAARAEALANGGTLPMDVFERFRAEAVQACNGHTEFTELLARYAPAEAFG